MPAELRQPMKGLINVFLWCDISHLNLNGVKLEGITKKDKEIVKDLNYSSVDFPVSKKNYCKIEILNKICVNVFC